MRQKIFVTNTSQWDKNVREKIFFQDWSHIGFWCVSVDFNQQYRRTVTFLSISNLLSLVYSACFIQVYCIANHAWNSANGWWWGIVEIFILSPFLWHCKSFFLIEFDIHHKLDSRWILQIFSILSFQACTLCLWVLASRWSAESGPNFPQRDPVGEKHHPRRAPGFPALMVVVSF